MPVEPAGRDRRLVAVSLVLSAAVVSLAGSRNEVEGSRPEACSLLDEVGEPVDLALTVTPGRAEPGDLVAVGRTDGGRMDFGPFLLYGDADVGCRTFALERDGDGPSWREVTGMTRFGVGSVVSPAQRTESYELPEVADRGTYLLCTAEGDRTLCARLTI